MGEEGRINFKSDSKRIFFCSKRWLKQSHGTRKHKLGKYRVV
jgi:hypothetical protein